MFPTPLALSAGAATLDLLRGRCHATLATLLGTVACAPLPPSAEQVPPSLHQRAWLLQLHALELHAVDLALPMHAESLNSLLVALFADDDALSAPEGAPSGAVGLCCRSCLCCAERHASRGQCLCVPASPLPQAQPL